MGGSLPFTAALCQSKDIVGCQGPQTAAGAVWYKCESVGPAAVRSPAAAGGPELILQGVHQSPQWCGCLCRETKTELIPLPGPSAPSLQLPSYTPLSRETAKTWSQHTSLDQESNPNVREHPCPSQGQDERRWHGHSLGHYTGIQRTGTCLLHRQESPKTGCQVKKLRLGSARSAGGPQVGSLSIARML